MACAAGSRTYSNERVQFAQKPQRLADRRIPRLLDLEGGQPEEGTIIIVVRAADAGEVGHRLDRRWSAGRRSRLAEALFGGWCPDKSGGRISLGN